MILLETQSKDNFVQSIYINKAREKRLKILPREKIYHNKNYIEKMLFVLLAAEICSRSLVSGN